MLRSLLASFAVLALGLSACGGGHKAVQQVGANPQVKRDEAAAQAKVQGCARHANFITKAGRKGFVKCIAPPGEQVKVEKCAQGKFASDGVFTKRSRAKLTQDIAGCLVR